MLEHQLRAGCPLFERCWAKTATRRMGPAVRASGSPSPEPAARAAPPTYRPAPMRNRAGLPESRPARSASGTAPGPPTRRWRPPIPDQKCKSPFELTAFADGDAGLRQPVHRAGVEEQEDCLKETRLAEWEVEVGEALCAGLPLGRGHRGLDLTQSGPDARFVPVPGYLLNPGGRQIERHERAAASWEAVAVRGRSCGRSEDRRRTARAPDFR